MIENLSFRSINLFLHNFTDLEHNRNNESELIDYLLHRYNRQARPIRDLV